MEKTYLIGEFSQLTGTSVRTLHYYDEIGLLKPNKLPSGHRSYSHENLITLQKIISLKLLSFSLEQIASMLKNPNYDHSLLNMLQLQQFSLEKKREEISISLEVVERMILILRSEGKLEEEMLFSLIKNMQQQNKQRDWIALHLSDQLASSLFNLSLEEKTSLDLQFIQFTKDVKQLSQASYDSPEAEQTINKYVKTVIMYLGRENLVRSQKIDEKQLIKLEQMIDVPFGDKEREWLELAIDHYMGKYTMREEKGHE